MVITKVPFRMSFFGGGTDYEPFFNEHGGSVIATTFDKYSYTTVRHLPPFFEANNNIVYSKIENTLDVDEIQHPVVRNAMKMLDMHDMRVVYDSDLPARSGLGSSSSFAVSLLMGFYALKGKYADKHRLASDAIHLERTLCAESGGWQDQIATAYGGLNRINFSKGDFVVNPIIMPMERKSLLNSHLMLVFTGFSRLSAEIADSQVKSIKNNKSELMEILEMVDEGEKILTGKCNISEFGRLLDHAWQVKRGLSKQITTNEIDIIYQKAKDSGAIGGKLMGAGGGGFLMLFAEPDKQAAIRERLIDLTHVPFKFEESGAQVLYYTPEDYIKAPKDHMIQRKQFDDEVFTAVNNF